MLKSLEALRLARQLITDPANWTRGTFAEDANGCTISPVLPGAVCYCAIGALCKVTGYNPMDGGARLNDMPGFTDLSRQVRRLRAYDSVGAYNDSHDHAEVLGLFDETIKGLE